MTTFAELGLGAPILQALETEGYTNPTPIQAQAIPPVLARRDLLGIAQTGTGKTAAFALPIIELLASTPRRADRKGCRVLVLSPTRELASQIADSFRRYGGRHDIKVAVVFGGVGHRPQVQAMARGVDVLVATPGRLLDHVASRDIALQSTEILVLDEADQMLDLGFVRPIRRIVSHLPQRRQNLFFSATMPREIGALASELLHDPVRVAVTPAATTVEAVSQKVIHIGASRKRALLVELLADAKMARTLVFTRTKRGADRVARHLSEAGIGVSAIHGNKSQRQREQALEAFRGSQIRVLVATDIAARGIDIDEVSHVVNYELPDVPESYVHRIGRTARAGATGAAISFCASEELEQLRNIERVTRQRIPAEDRRNDTSLTADRPVVRGPRHGHGSGHGRGEGAAKSNHGQHRNGRNNGHGEGRRPSRNGRSGPAHGDTAHASGHNGQSARVVAMPRAPVAGDKSGMAGIAFMAAPNSGAKARGRGGAGHRYGGSGRRARG